MNSAQIVFLFLKTKNMSISINPKDYNLNSRVLLQQIDNDSIAIVKKRKSRIIMKDGKQILEQAMAIRNVNPKLRIYLIVENKNICSKTIMFLSDNGVELFL